MVFLPPAGSQASSEEDPKLSDTWRFYEAQEPYISRNIQFCDTKAGVEIVAFSGVIALMARDPTFISTVRSFRFHGSELLADLTWASVLALLALLCTGLAIVLAFISVMPRGDAAGDFRGGDGSSRKNTGPAVSWIAVATRPSADIYAQEIKAVEDEVLVLACLRQLHALSKICAQKMALVAWSLRIGSGGFVLSFLWLVLFGKAQP